MIEAIRTLFDHLQESILEFLKMGGPVAMVGMVQSRRTTDTGKTWMKVLAGIAGGLVLGASGGAAAYLIGVIINDPVQDRDIMKIREDLKIHADIDWQRYQETKERHFANAEAIKELRKDIYSIKRKVE